MKNTLSENRMVQPMGWSANVDGELAKGLQTIISASSTDKHINWSGNHTRPHKKTSTGAHSHLKVIQIGLFLSHHLSHAVSELESQGVLGVDLVLCAELDAAGVVGCQLSVAEAGDAGQGAAPVGRLLLLLLLTPLRLLVMLRRRIPGSLDHRQTAHTTYRWLRQYLCSIHYHSVVVSDKHVNLHAPECLCTHQLQPISLTPLVALLSNSVCSSATPRLCSALPAVYRTARHRVRLRDCCGGRWGTVCPWSRRPTRGFVSSPAR